ncbi:Fc.00g046310.m01.CDS01 [Cosmosporella sp. VM-42]
MASTTGIPPPYHGSPSNPTLQVDFAWRKMKALITDRESPETPSYIVDFQTIKSPHIIFKSTADEREIGNGTLHPISINADYKLHGRKGQLKALKRFMTEYTHLSRAYSDDDSLATMIWTSKGSFKTWDFICNDENMNPVAKFSASCWAVKKVGNIEFIGPKSTSREAQEEIIVTGLTLFYCMLLRSASILSLFGAIFARPGPIKGVANESQQDNAYGKKDETMVSRHEVAEPYKSKS